MGKNTKERRRGRLSSEELALLENLYDRGAFTLEDVLNGYELRHRVAVMRMIHTLADKGFLKATFSPKGTIYNPTKTLRNISNYLVY